MSALALARRMQVLTARLDGFWRMAGATQCHFQEAPFGTAYVCMSPSEQGPHASSNHNRVLLCGADGGLTAEGVVSLIRQFDAAGITRFFFWLSPGPDIDAVRSWFADAGLKRRPFVAYPTLVRDAREPTPIETELDVRELGADEIASLAPRLEGVAWPEYVRCADRPGFHHFMAFAHGEPAASAVLYAFEDLGYLSLGLTGEAFRRRGAQRALIAARIEKAIALGCRTLVSETLSILEDSLSNLMKAGFEPIYEKEVYERASIR
jgi:GNAT superfamily N-acetyltransferase